MAILYFILAIAATTCGSLAGIGGGVIIKPVLDLLGRDSLPAISVLSSATVFSMALFSTVKQLIGGFRPERRMLILAAGAVAGGLAGGALFSSLSAGLDHQLLKGVQALIIAIMLLPAAFRRFLPDYEINNPLLSAAVGIFLGLAAAFLGIGGGPVNVAVLCMLLAMEVRDAAVISILIILFSQGAKLSLIAATGGFGGYGGLEMLIFMIPAGIAGGLIGSKLNRKLSEKIIARFFQVMISIIIILNLYNAAAAFAE